MFIRSDQRHKKTFDGGRYNPREGGREGVAAFFFYIISHFLYDFIYFFGSKSGRAISKVTEGEGVVCTCLDVKSVYFFCFLNNSILQSGMVEHLRLLQNCQQIENHYFQLIHKILKNSSVRFEYTAI